MKNNFQLENPPKFQVFGYLRLYVSVCMQSQECMGINSLIFTLCCVSIQPVSISTVKFLFEAFDTIYMNQWSFKFIEISNFGHHSVPEVPLRFSSIVSITVNQNWVDIRLTTSKENLSYRLSLSKVSCKTNITKFHHTSICNPFQQRS